MDTSNNNNNNNNNDNNKGGGGSGNDNDIQAPENNSNVYVDVPARGRAGKTLKAKSSKTPEVKGIGKIIK